MYGGTTRGSYGQMATEDKLGDIFIANIPDAEGQYLRNALIDKFYRRGRPANPNYTLDIQPLQETVIDLDVTIESETTREQLNITSSMQLVEKGSGKVLLNRPLRASASYNVLGSQYTTIVTETDAREAALNDIARQVETQLSLYFSRQ